MGFFLDDICVVIGIAVLWIARGCKYNLWKEMKTVNIGDFFLRREGFIGLASLFVMIGLILIFIKLF